MGNLPRSRPGRRSEKRASEVKPAKPKATRAKAASGGAKKAATTGARKSPTRKARAGGKRAAPATAKAKPTRARAGGPAATTPSAGLGDERAPKAAVRDERVESPPGSDPITAALRLGMSLGDAGLKAVAKIAQRLPRP